MDFHTLYKYICQFFLSIQVGVSSPSSSSLTLWSLLLLFRLVTACLLSQIVWSLDEVMLLNPPDETLPNHLLKVLYSCDGPATVQLDCVVSFETGMVSTFLLREWSCVPSDPVIRTVKLNLPDWLVYQADGILPDSDWVLSCILRASVRYSGLNDAETLIAAQDVATLQRTPFFSRPFKSHQLCFAWSRQMLQLTQRFLKRQCPFEQGKVGEESLKTANEPDKMEK